MVGRHSLPFYSRLPRQFGLLDGLMTEALQEVGIDLRGDSLSLRQREEVHQMLRAVTDWRSTPNHDRLARVPALATC